MSLDTNKDFETSFAYNDGVYYDKQMKTIYDFWSHELQPKKIEKRKSQTNTSCKKLYNVPKMVLHKTNNIFRCCVLKTVHDS